MKSKTFKVAVAFIGFCIGVFCFWLLQPCSTSTELSLIITTEPTLEQDIHNIKIKAVITNNGQRVVRLVKPGDGSESGWRTPITRWQVKLLGEEKAKLSPLLARCGNVGALDWGESFLLYPHQSIEFGDSFFDPILYNPGTYKVSMIYTNQPELPWRGIVIGEHNPWELWFVRHSTACKLVSNEITITVGNKSTQPAHAPDSFPPGTSMTGKLVGRHSPVMPAVGLRSDISKCFVRGFR